MDGYLGEEILNVKQTPFKDYNSKDWALLFIEYYGSIDGEHHKERLIVDVAKILMGTPVIVKLAKWDSGFTEYRFTIKDADELTIKWLKEIELIGDDNDEW